MNPFVSWAPETLLSMSQIVAAFLTAFATIALVAVTIILARATKRMASASSQPFVTATIEPNIWSMMHCDIVLQNTGNAPAFDVRVIANPEFPKSDLRGNGGLPLQNVSVLRPGQELKSFLTESKDVLDQAYRIEVTWKRNPRDQSSEGIEYDHYLPKNISRLGDWSPEIQIADQLKKLREDWKQIASGTRKLAVNSYGRTDRQEERKRFEEIQEPQRGSEK
ncbi:MAG: hypothetical protein OXG59_06795 [Gammaproteobacteria bacterium]|nr:hypothetical protein [Gammaproteobacteria bacterium]